MILPFQGLRAIAAIYIVFFHVCQLTSAFASHICDLSVGFFFVLSGFLLSYPHYQTYKAYALGRFARLMPLNIVTLVMVAILFHNDFFAKILPYTLDLFMMQSWIPDSFYYFSGNSVAWFLSTILFCYLLCPLLSRLLNHSMIFSIAILTLVIIIVMVSAALFCPENKYIAILYVAPYTRFIDFFTGMIMARISAQVKTSPTFQYLSLTVLAAFILTCPYIPIYITLALWWIFPLALFIGSLSNNGETIIERVLSCTLLVWLGNHSFGIFMYHLPTLWFIRIAANKIGLKIPNRSAKTLS